MPPYLSHALLIGNVILLVGLRAYLMGDLAHGVGLNAAARAEADQQPQLVVSLAQSLASFALLSSLVPVVIRWPRLCWIVTVQGPSCVTTLPAMPGPVTCSPTAKA